MPKKLIVLLVALLIARVTWASPFSEGIQDQKNHPKSLGEMERVLFPTRLDSSSPTPSFRLVSKSKKGSGNSIFEKSSLNQFPYIESTNLFEPLGDIFLPEPAGSKDKGSFQIGYGNYRLSHKLLLEAHYTDFENLGPLHFQDPEDYGKVLKTTSLGIAYPLTSRLTLDGRYAIVKGEALDSVSPFLGATYRVNTATSISISYHNLSGSGENPMTDSDKSHAAAELKIHF